MSDEEAVVPPSDLESDCSECDVGFDVDIPGFDNENDLVLQNRRSDTSSDWDSDDHISLATIRTNIIRQKEPTWLKSNKPDPPSSFDETDCGVPDFIKKLIKPTPFQVFQLFISDQLLDRIVYQTNLYAAQGHITSGKKYTQTDIDEIKVFLGINILMGIKHLPSYRDHWSSEPDLHDYFISNLMSVNRFRWLLGNLHLNDNISMPRNYDKLYKLRPFLSSLEESFQRCLHLHEHVAIDEGMIRFKGRNSLKQYMPKTPI
ncbi:hypothetical protein NQ314_010029 [Rhamnusium bicolor]|uniref:PiggyBac transposable element-derived protein domain-containing protein n=1 Tax=Rhamnusium bicolor TaxID=1586634 RepID=A0AAV8XUA3_9CUCU|nr:hypothetical protein NQ314_010029 [Rhamnusium bicolor]